MEVSQTSAQSTLFAEASRSRAKISALLESEKAFAASAQACGRSTPALFANYDLVSSSWRTSQACLMETWASYSETWPRSGLMRNGIAYQLPPLVPRTFATACGLSLIPTPTACDHKGSGRLRLERGENNNLRDWCKIKFGFLYPPVRLVEFLMGYPTDHTALKRWETQ
jgi:hypothetical protein